MAVTFDFGGDASRLIAEMRKIQQEVRAESQTRREADRVSRQLSKAESDRIRDQIRFGRQAKQSTEELAQSAIDVLKRARDPWQQYTAEIYKHEQALQKGAISQDQFRRVKIELLKKMREAKQAQSGENEETKEAAALVERTRTATERYQIAVDKLNRLKQKGKIDAETYNRALRAEQQQLQKTGSSLMQMKSSLVAVGVAGVAFIALMDRMATAVRDTRNEINQQAVAVDTLSRQLQIQAGLTDLQRSETTQEILAIAERRGVSKEQAFSVATQAVSSGFVDPVRSGTVEQFLKTQQASNFDGDVKELVQATAEFLNAFGKERTLQNVESLTVGVHSLFKGTDIQLVDLKEFAKVAAVLKEAGMSQQEALASSTVLREILPAGETATAIKNFVAVLELAGSKKNQRAALKSIGVDPTEVDFVGESILQVAQRLNAGLQSVDKATANIAAGKLFGRENLGSAQAFLANADKITQFVDLQRKAADAAQFNADAQVAAASKQAELNRFDVRSARTSLEAGDAAFSQELERKKFQQQMEEARAAVVANEEITAAGRAARLNLLRVGQKTVETFEDVGVPVGMPVDSISSFPMSRLPLIGRFFGGGEASPEQVKPPVVNVQVPKPEPVRVDVNAPQPEPVRVDVNNPKPEPVRVDVNAPKPEPVRVDVNAPQPEPVRVDVNAPQPEPVRVDVNAPKPEPVRVNVNAPKPEPVRVDVNAPKPEPVRVDLKESPSEQLSGRLRQAEQIFQNALSQLPAKERMEVRKDLKRLDQPGTDDDFESRAKAIEAAWQRNQMTGNPAAEIRAVDPLVAIEPVVSLLQDIRDSLRVRPGAAVAAQAMGVQREAVARYRNREGAA